MMMVLIYLPPLEKPVTKVKVHFNHCLFVSKRILKKFIKLTVVIKILPNIPLFKQFLYQDLPEGCKSVKFRKFHFNFSLLTFKLKQCILY